MSTLVFVYGTLKQGFPNFLRNPGMRIGGVFRTCDALPLFVVELPFEPRAPWLVDRPGSGMQVLGEVFAIEPADLGALDAFEEVGLPGGYVRKPIMVEAVDAPPSVLQVQAYLKPADQLAAAPQREGPYAEYTLALARGYRLDAG